MRSEGYSTCFVCLSVCLSVTTLAATVFISACNQRHLRHTFRLFLDLSSWLRVSAKGKSVGTRIKDGDTLAFYYLSRFNLTQAALELEIA